MDTKTKIKVALVLFGMILFTGFVLAQANRANEIAENETPQQPIIFNASQYSFENGALNCTMIYENGERLANISYLNGNFLPLTGGTTTGPITVGTPDMEINVAPGVIKMADNSPVMVYNFSVNNAYNFPETMGSPGQVLKVPVSGKLLYFTADSDTGAIAELSALHPGFLINVTNLTATRADQANLTIRFGNATYNGYAGFSDPDGNPRLFFSAATKVNIFGSGAYFMVTNDTTNYFLVDMRSTGATALSVVPVTAMDLGTTTFKWKNLFVSNNITIGPTPGNIYLNSSDGNFPWFNNGTSVKRMVV